MLCVVRTTVPANSTAVHISHYNHIKQIYYNAVRIKCTGISVTRTDVLMILPLLDDDEVTRHIMCTNKKNHRSWDAIYI